MKINYINDALDSLICEELVHDYAFVARVNKMFREFFYYNIDDLTVEERKEYFRMTLNNGTRGYILRYVAYLYLATTLRANAHDFVDETAFGKLDEIASIFDYKED